MLTDNRLKLKWGTNKALFKVKEDDNLMDPYFVVGIVVPFGSLMGLTWDMGTKFLKEEILGVMWSDAPLSIIQESLCELIAELQEGRILPAKFAVDGCSFVESIDNNCWYCSTVRPRIWIVGWDDELLSVGMRWSSSYCGFVVVEAATWDRFECF